MADILYTAADKIDEFYKDNDIKPSRMNSVEMVCTVTTNIFVNLLQNIIKKEASRDNRLKMVVGCLEKTANMSLELWDFIDSALVNEKMQH